MKYANASGIPLSMAVFLATDNYDHDDDPYTISATALLKPLRQLILAARVAPEDNLPDILNLVQSRMGSAIHDSIERAWTTNHTAALKQLGYPEGMIKRVLVNPDPAAVPEGHIPVYLEQRNKKKVGKYTISGKFDFVGDGRVEDFKTTSTYTYTNQTNDEKYVLQGSIYRWLDPQRITRDEMAIQFIFTDWNKARASTESGYPKKRTEQKIFVLKSLSETETFIHRKLALLDQYRDAEEKDIPLCTDEELWRSSPVFKYYKNPGKMARSTKNFDTLQEAQVRKAEDGNVGVVVEQPGQVTACRYCAAFSVCTQKDMLIAAGDLQP